MIEATSFHRSLAGIPASPAVTFYTDDDVADPGTVSVTITRHDGTVLVADRSTTGEGENPRVVELDAAETADLDLLTLDWSGSIDGVSVTVRTHAEIVGAHLFPLSEVRRFGKQKMKDPARYTLDELARGRAAVTDVFEVLTGVSFIPRFIQREVTGECDDMLILPDRDIRTLRSLEVRQSDGTWADFTDHALSALHLDSAGIVTRPAGTFKGRYRVGYEYGRSFAPADIVDAALTYMNYIVVESTVPDRATYMANELGQWRVAQPGDRPNSWLGIPKVDAALSRYRKRTIALR